MASLDFPSSSLTALSNSRHVVETWYLNQYLKPAAATSVSRAVSTTTDGSASERGTSSQNNAKDEEYLRVRTEFREIRKNCHHLGIKYDDVDFPPTKSSLLRGHPTSETSRPVNEEERFPTVTRWLRPGNISFNGRGNDSTDEWVLISDPCPSDIRQGMQKKVLIKI